MIKTYASLGPACSTVEVLRPMLAQGLTGLRLNLSHGTLDSFRPWLDAVHTAAVLEGVSPELIFDLQGSETRIGELSAPLTLVTGQTVSLGRTGIPADEDVVAALTPGQQILLSDGEIELTAQSVAYGSATCRVTLGGTLTSRKSLYLPNAFPDRPVLSEKDRAELPRALKWGATAIMHPFVRRRQELVELRAFLHENDLDALRLFAKVEDPTGVENLPDWMALCDEVVIARGDLGTTVPLWVLPRVQKAIAALCRKSKKPFMVCTQLLESMIHQPKPTRAELLDVYNACLDGASSLLLTGETTTGQYPVEAVTMLERLVREAEHRA
jgi:pyruvate kinase